MRSKYYISTCFKEQIIYKNKRAKVIYKSENESHLNFMSYIKIFSKTEREKFSS